MKPKLYLAGGFHGDWRKIIKELLKDSFIFLDPLTPEIDPESGKRKNLSFDEYTAWDLWAIRTADIVFVYSEKTNPGQGYIVEAGYAKGLGKTVILVREDDNEYMPDKYLQFLDCIADYKTFSLTEGIKVLSRFTY
ncbi:MAG TPA: nucleoside 2-deoxyribosyltransferase domain-containing protein [Candidatus Bathyarchaeia archaeon]|nr:nucleoside 2-deoxyribosyltransferase domain-containing protein [Candidatus Bathyarchaeia archaeon]